MEWHDIQNPADPQLDLLAERYHLHPLHVEDCRHRDQRGKIELGEGYLFIVLKPLRLKGDDSLDAGDLDVFIGADFIVTVQEEEHPEVRQMVATLKSAGRNSSPDQVLHRVMDAIVDAYMPLLDRLDDGIDALEDEVLQNPQPESLVRLFSLKRCLIEIRRVMANMRDVANNLQRADSEFIRPQMQPFFRDVYDHLARNMDMVEGQRDLLMGTLEIYLSSVSNRTNQVVKVLTVVGTITLPALLVSSIYGMNVEGLPWAHAPTAVARLMGAMLVLTFALLGYMRWRRWL